jgi:hypothetical protein
MKMIKKMAAQGDVMFVRIDEIPADVTPVEPEQNRHILAHSETGHHHVTRADGVAYFRGPDPFTCYLRVDAIGAGAEVIHERPWDTHETVLLTPGSWLVRRQREYVPAGFRMVVD